jgi:hypothetical protein
MNMMIVPGGNMDVFRYRLFGPVGSQRVGFIGLKVVRDGGGKRDVSGLTIHFEYDVNGTLGLSGMSSGAECTSYGVETHSSLAVSVGQVKRGKDRIGSKILHPVKRYRGRGYNQTELEFPWV